MKKYCFEDYKWLISIEIIILILEVVLVLITYTVGYMMGDTDATRQCIELRQQRKY